MGYAFTWIGACLGMVLRNVEAAQVTGFVVFLPLTFVSNARWPPPAGTCSATPARPAWGTAGRCSIPS